MSAYAKAIASGVIGLAAVAYVVVTGGDVEGAKAIATEWEAAFFALINTGFVYFVKNKS